MCGITGIYSSEIFERDKFFSSCKLLEHRGPNGFGFYEEDRLLLAHKRLSILDLSESGKQPMISETHGIVITVNGEIYNYKELKSELSRKYTFRGESDSEVVLWGYIEWGINGLLSRIDGMYAIAIFDKAKNEILLARDRSGIKPLFYYYDGKTLHWSSEIEPIRYYHDSLSIDNTALYDYLTYTYVPHPKTIYKKVFKLPQASYLSFSITEKNINLHKYWNCFEIEDSNLSFNQAVEEAEFLLRKSIKEQLISDVPIGAFLSGGIDSSLVSLYSQQQLGSSNKLDTYTIGFPNSKQDESYFAKKAAEIIGSNHISSDVTEEEACSFLDMNETWFHEPFYDSSAIPSFILSKLSSRKSTVILGGDGADELFGGYNWYIRNKKSHPGNTHLGKLYEKLFGIDFKYINKINRRIIPSYFCDDLTNFAIKHGSPMNYEKKKLKHQLEIDSDYDDLWAYRRYYKPSLGQRKSLQYIDFNMFMVDDVLTKVDRVSMRNSIEVRVPFLSHELIKLGLSLSEDAIYKNGLKSILKEIYYKSFDKNIFERKKQGFSLPITDWKDKMGYKRYPHEEQIKKYI